MLGKTAGGLFWMFRHLERAENTARLVETGWRIALTRSDSADSEWESVLKTAGAHDGYVAKFDGIASDKVINYLLRDKDNPSSVLSSITEARVNARMVRTALSSEVWEATNECWMSLKSALARPVSDRNLAQVLSSIRNSSAVVRGALHGTMLRNDIFSFARLGTFLERADNTARILDVKYYILLPSAASVGSVMDNTQWETILSSVSAERSFRWLHAGDTSPRSIADFLILDRRMPRSLAFSYSKIGENLNLLERDYATTQDCHELARKICARYVDCSIETVFDDGLHEFLQDSIQSTAKLASVIERDFRFYQ